jgi:tripeptidyl-peptidase-1
MMILTLLTVLAVLSSAVANYVRMEPSVQTFTSSKWLKETAALGDDEVIRCVFVLKHDPAALQQFEHHLLDISTPSSVRYGKWLKHEDVMARLSPSEEKVKIVKDYLIASGVSPDKIAVSRLRDLIEVEMPAKAARTALRTDFALFRNVVERDVVLPRITKPYFLPQEVAEVVSIVDDIMRFPALRSAPHSYGAEQKATADSEFSSCGTKCNGFTTPAVLQKRYGYETVTSVALGNSMSVAEFQYQYYDNTDLKSFSSACGVTATVETTIGGNNEKICEAGGCVEALLDIEYIEAVAHPIPLTVVYVAQFSLLNWINQVIAMTNPPLVHSVSYGNDEVQQTSTEYMNSVNTQFMIAGSMGLSILFASGDQGVWGRTGVSKQFNPDFPAASPYVTAVGGTDFATKSTIGDETAWSCGGGGFSNTFAMPSWQTSAVQGYLASAGSALPASNLYNATGRAYPDISALGGQVNPYCVGIKGGSFGGVAGTSASCPVAAGIFAQLNNVRLANGKTALGWLNPLIYSNGQCFHDVNDGSQNNCNAGTTGFPATTGWDAATGFGSPDFACLAKVVA